MNTEKKVILLLIPPVINYFTFPSNEKQWFLDLRETKKKIFSEKKEILKLIDHDYSQKIKEMITQPKSPSKLILINYPRDQEQLLNLNKALMLEKQKIIKVILLALPNYELMENIKKEYLICPFCEKIYPKKEVVKGEKVFLCPKDEYELSVAKVEEFNEHLMRYFLNSQRSLIEALRQENQNPTFILQLTVNRKEEIFAPEIPKKILEIINSL